VQVSGLPQGVRRPAGSAAEVEGKDRKPTGLGAGTSKPKETAYWFKLLTEPSCEARALRGN
jgi:hypothetical protein